MALTGAGQLFVRTTNMTNSLRGENLIFPLCVASFEMSFDTQLAEAKCLIDGTRQITSAAITEQTATVNLNFEFADFNVLGFAYDELPQLGTAVPIPVLKTATVPATTPFEINDTDITAGNAASVLAYNATTKTFLKRATAAPTAGEFQAAAGKITLAAAAAGQVIQYSTLKTFASVQTLGVGQQADSFGVLEFWGMLYQGDGERYLINIPRLSRVGTPNISISGDIAEIAVEFRASVPAGARKPYALYKIN